MSIESLMIPLNQLRHGSDPDAGIYINARVTNKTEGATAIAASATAIRRKIPDHPGIVQALAVARKGKKYFVIAGGVRLAALHLLLKDKLIQPDHAVPAVCHGDVDDLNEVALEMSVIENAQRNPLNPIDEYEAYANIEAGMRQAGEKDADIVATIALSFAVSEKLVRQRLALGRTLSPGARKAWRDGLIDAASAKVLTLAPSHQAQDRALGMLDPGEGLDANAVRNALGLGAEGDAQRFVHFIGPDIYQAAGGQIVVDLFGINHQISDPGLAAKLAADKLLAEAEAIKIGEGWAWACPAIDAPGYQSWQRTFPRPGTDAQQQRMADLDDIMENNDTESPAWQAADQEQAALQNDIDAGGYSRAQVKKLGCVLFIGREGQLEIVRGLERPDERKAQQAPPGSAPQQQSAGPAQPAPEEKEGPGISQALTAQLHVLMADAARHALDKDPALGVAAMMAAMLHHGPAPVRINRNGIAGASHTYPERLKKRDQSFGAVMRSLHKQPAATRTNTLVMLIGDALDLGGGMENEDVAAFANALPPAVMLKELRERFQRGAYFQAVNMGLLVEIVDECLGADAAATVVKMKKAAAVKFCVANIPKKWLPPQLRTKHYDGPKAKPARK